MSVYDTELGTSSAVDQICYGGFWRRFGAITLDLLIVLPLMGPLSWWGNEHYRLFQVYYFVPGFLFSLYYGVYLVHRYGGTPGKLMVGLRIRKLDGTEVGYREAFLRQLPDLIFNIVASAGAAYAVLTINDAQYFSMTNVNRLNLVGTFAPAWWWHYFNVAQNVWSWSELVVMMTNRKRRALHDFIAGTVVIVNGPRGS